MAFNLMESGPKNQSFGGSIGGGPVGQPVPQFHSQQNNQAIGGSIGGGPVGQPVPQFHTQQAPGYQNQQSMPVNPAVASPQNSGLGMMAAPENTRGYQTTFDFHTQPVQQQLPMPEIPRVQFQGRQDEIATPQQNTGQMNAEMISSQILPLLLQVFGAMGQQQGQQQNTRMVDNASSRREALTNNSYSANANNPWSAANFQIGRPQAQAQLVPFSNQQSPYLQRQQQQSPADMIGALLSFYMNQGQRG